CVQAAGEGSIFRCKSKAMCLWLTNMITERGGLRVALFYGNAPF
ncbi:MAG: hypothetical protein ACJATG_002080, partial [Dinoroseobacter sp.]